MRDAIKLTSNAGLPGITSGSATFGRGATAVTPKGVGPIGPLVLVVTAAEVLREAQKMNRERALLAVVERFNLDRNVDADMLAAEAYLWTQFTAPWVFTRLPNDRDILDKVGQAVMEYERANPTTLRRSDRGDQKAINEIRRVVDEALLGLGIGAAEAAVYRTSNVDSKLSASSERCRALLGLTNQDWRAHHLIPFAEVAKLPRPVQVAFVKSGWAMDQIENLIALPANLPFYSTLPNPKGPVHNSPHTKYSIDVEVALRPISIKAVTMPSLTLLSDLRMLQATFRMKLLNSLGKYHPILQ